MRLGRWRFPILRVTIIGALILAAWWAATRDDLTGDAIVGDGDSITVAGTKIRIYGIDAPELDQTCSDRAGSIYACGRLAQRHMQKIAKGKIRCETVETDQYGREVSICYAGDVDLGAAMVNAGWARAYLRYSLRYASAEQAAKDARRGMWDGDFDDPWAYREDGVQDDLIAFAWRWVMERLF